MNALRKSIKSAILLFVLMLLKTTLFAQLTANFTAVSTSGCAPIVVQFNDQSSGNPTQWKWDLGNGTISVLQNPSATYFNPGTYHVKLVVRNTAGNADSIIRNQYITVYASPSVNLKASDSSGCAPLDVQFTNQSTAGSGTVSSYLWDFGDGTTATLQNPSHGYAAAGNYTVTLKATNSFGCATTFSKTQYIKVGSGVQSGFTQTISGQCAAPVPVSFVNTSTGSGIVSYQWNFGDGTTSTVLNPAHTYTAAGSYTVSLITISSQGCRDTLVKPNLVRIGTLKSDFNSPNTLCEGESLMLTNISSPSPASSFWSFGDGTTSTLVHPTKKYSAAGTYTIKLVNFFGGCTDSVTKTITVKAKPAALIMASDSSFCATPATVNFGTANAGFYHWDFGDGSIATQQNPSHTYITEGDYTVSLIVTNANGCSDTVMKTDYIKIHKPKISVIGLPQAGCVPLPIHPSVIVASNEPVINYQWNFGDGSFGLGMSPNHTYTTAGTYKVSVVLTTASGCVDSLVITDAVKAGNKPSAHFIINPTDACAFSPVSFIDKSIGKTDQWYWQFGDGGTSTSSNPVYQYADTGWFDVQLVTWSNGCADTLKQLNAVHIKPPIAVFGFNRTCTNKFKIDFIDHSIGAVTYQWSFGDGATATLQNPSHTYARQGSYIVTLTVSNGTCAHVTQQKIDIIQETAGFTGDAVVCKNTTAHFSASANSNNISQWDWNFGDGSTANTAQTATHSYSSAGVYSVTLTITDLFGCTDTKSFTTKVYGPTAAFSSNQSYACLNNNSIVFSDQSKSDATNAIVKRIWNYGDGIMDSTSSMPYIHSYKAIGSYTVLLKVVDSYGCSDQASGPAAIVISKPSVQFFSGDTISCTDRPIQFANTSSGNNLNYQWNFGDGAQSNLDNPSHNYNAVGIYSVKLIAIDSYGCKDSLTRSSYINISFPKSSFTLSDSVGTCPPLNVLFANHAANYTSLQWDFGDGATSTLLNPSHYYTVAGTYYAKLTVRGPGGCTDVMTKKIVVRGPKGSFTYDPQTGCAPLTTKFTAHTQDNLSFLWDFSDGVTKSGADSVVTHTYPSLGNYVPKMIMIDATGCSVPITGIDTIKVRDVTAQLKMDKVKLCDSGNVNFTNASFSNDTIVSYQWNFGDGASGSSPNPSHQFTTSGTYSVQLTAVTQTGCTNMIVLKDTITVFQSPLIHVTGDSAQCLPATIHSNAFVDRGNANIVKWNWDFGNGQTSAVQTAPAQTYTVAGPYIINVVAIDNHGCKDSSARTVYARPLPPTNAGSDALVCEGSSINLNATGAVQYNWKASSYLSCTACAHPVAKPNDTTSFVVTGTNAYGCSTDDTVRINVRHPFALSVNKGDTICLGKTVHLRASGADYYSWYPAANVDNATSATTTAKPTQTTLYQVIAKDKDNCFTDTGYVPVQVWQLPTVSASVDQTIVVGTNTQLKATGSADVVSYQWSPAYNLSCISCPDPVAMPKQDTKYAVQVMNAGGCTAQSEVSIFVTCGKGNVFIPNTFSPNGDGNNDVFFPRGVGIDKIKALRVFNRWGEVVFEQKEFNVNDESKGWDGKFKGQPLPADVYVYACEVVCENNEVLIYRGDVTLLK